MEQTPLTLLLASGSPRRKQLLSEAGVRLRVQPAQVTEWEAEDADAAALVAHNAALKADAVAQLEPALPVLAADTTVALGARVLNKPADLDEARAMLLSLSGRRHTVYTAVSLRRRAQGVAVDFIEASQVQFRPLDDAIIAAYFARVNPLDKAGAYGIQEGRELIIDHWEGSLSNIMGLPLARVQAELERLGWWRALMQ